MAVTGGTLDGVFSAPPGSAGLGDSQVYDAHRPGNSRSAGSDSDSPGVSRSYLMRRWEEIALVEDLDFTSGWCLASWRTLRFFLVTSFLIHRRDLDEQALLREEEVGSEVSDGRTRCIELSRKRGGLVFPGDAVEIEESGKLSFAFVGEFDGVGQTPEVDGRRQASPVAAMPGERCGLVGEEAMDLAFHLRLDRADGDPENALTPSEHVNDLVSAVCRVDRDSVRQQGDVGQWTVAVELGPQGGPLPGESS